MNIRYTHAFVAPPRCQTCGDIEPTHYIGNAGREHAFVAPYMTEMERLAEEERAEAAPPPAEARATVKDSLTVEKCRRCGKSRADILACYYHGSGPVTFGERGVPHDFGDAPPPSAKLTRSAYENLVRWPSHLGNVLTEKGVATLLAHFDAAEAELAEAVKALEEIATTECHEQQWHSCCGAVAIASKALARAGGERG